MSKLPNFWQFFNLTSQPTIPSLYWDAYSYEERIKKVCDKIWAILNYLKLVMESLNEFDDRLIVLEELYNSLEARVANLEYLHEELKLRVDQHDIDIQNLVERVNNIDTQLIEINQTINELDGRITQNTTDIAQNANNITQLNTQLQSLSSSVNDIQQDLVNVKVDIARALLGDSLSLKIANPDTNTTLNKVVEKNKLMVFKNGANATFDESTQEWSLNGPFVIDSANLEVGTWDEIVGSSVTITDVNIKRNAIILDDGVTRFITDNNRNYYLIMMICNAYGNIGYFKDEQNGLTVMFTKKFDSTTWFREINTFIKETDPAVAKQNSLDNPNYIYYITEPEV